MTTWDDKPNDYEHAIGMLESIRNCTIEECAKVAESCVYPHPELAPSEVIAAAIRALKDKP